MTSRVTQCPKCQTSFRVTDAQLNIANSAVRCGSCLHIFNAPEHWIGTKIEPNAPDKQATSTEPQTSIDESFDDLLDDDDFLINDDSGFFDDDESTTEPASTVLSDSFLDMDNWEDSPTAIFNESVEVDDTDDSWTTQLLKDNSEEEDFILPEKKPGFDLHPEMLENNIETVDEGPELDSDLLDLLNEEQEQNYAPYEEDTSDQNFDNSEKITPSLNNSFSAGERIGDDESHYISPAEKPLNTHKENKQSLLDNIVPEPVELVALISHSRRRTFLWNLIILLAALGLPAQFVYYNFNDLSHHAQYRPFIKMSCQILHCKLPPLHAIHRIQSSNLMVRSHPTVKNALVVDAMMTNRANFKQLFPLLELQFTNINGNIIASRRFQPKEYLSGELTGFQKMPIKQPIHVSLAIIDPGAEAVNYQLIFLPQQP